MKNLYITGARISNGQLRPSTGLQYLSCNHNFNYLLKEKINWMKFILRAIDKPKFISIIAHYAPLAAIMVVASFFLFSNLGKQYLWQDEAETALIGKTIISHGLPYGTDGKNYFSQEKIGEARSKEPWRLHPWLQFYAVAASYLIFGIGTFSTRFPFAFFGLVTVFITYVLTLEQFRSRNLALTAAGLLAVSVPFLLLCRQGRYYSAGILFFILSIWSYTRLSKGSKYSILLFIIFSTLTFHSYYLFCLISLIGFLMHAIIFHRDKFKRLLMAIGVVSVINFPWFLWFKTYSLQDQSLFSISRIIYNLQLFKDQIYVFYYIPWIIGVVLIIPFLKYLRFKEYPHDFVDFIDPICLLIIMTIGITISGLIPAYPQFRYLSPIIPLLCILSAIIVRLAFKVQFLFGAAILVFLIWIQPLDKMLYEITHSFNGPMEGIVGYLKENSKNNDIVLVTYEDLPLKFYTNLRVIGGLTGENLKPARNADWVIVRKYMVSSYEIPVRRFIQENISTLNYQKITIDYPDTPFENRESPIRHYFKTVINEDRVVIYKRNQ
jgi:hypothetical protein